MNVTNSFHFKLKPTYAKIRLKQPENVTCGRILFELELCDKIYGRFMSSR